MVSKGTTHIYGKYYFHTFLGFLLQNNNIKCFRKLNSFLASFYVAFSQKAINYEKSILSCLNYISN